MVVFFKKIMKIPTQKGRALLQMYRVVPQMKKKEFLPDLKTVHHIDRTWQNVHS